MLGADIAKQLRTQKLASAVVHCQGEDDGIDIVQSIAEGVRCSAIILIQLCAAAKQETQ